MGGGLIGSNYADDDSALNLEKLLRPVKLRID